MLNYWLNWDEMIDINQSRQWALAQLTESPTPSADIDALLMMVIQKNKAYLWAHGEILLSDAQWQTFQCLIKKRQRGHPIAYLTGYKEFWSQRLQVTKDTLIPRPETECLVEQCLTLLKDKHKATLIDLGTGSGAIAIAIAATHPSWHVFAVDNNKATLDVAKRNAAKENCLNITFIHSDWLTKVPLQHVDAIVSNPPYIESNDNHLEQGDLRYEPIDALHSGADGLDAIRQIIKDSVPYLKPHGLLLLEHGFKQQPAVFNLLNAQGFQDCSTWHDLQGHPRVSGGWINEN